MSFDSACNVIILAILHQHHLQSEPLMKLEIMVNTLREVASLLGAHRQHLPDEVQNRPDHLQQRDVQTALTCDAEHVSHSYSQLDIKCIGMRHYCSPEENNFKSVTSLDVPYVRMRHP